MRVLIYVPYYLPATRFGGPVQSVHGLARTLVEQGHEVTVLTANLDGPEELDVPIDTPISIDGVQVYYFRIHTPRRLYYSPKMVRRAKSLMTQVDAVHINGVFLWPGPRITQIARNEGVPVTISPRGMLMPELVAGKSRWLKKLWLAFMGRKSIAMSSTIHVTVRAEAEGMRQLGLDLAPILVLPNGVIAPPVVDPDLIAQVWEGIPPGRRVLYLGRLGWNKGIDMAIRATHAHEDAHILIVGYDEVGLRQQLEPELSRADGLLCGAFLGQIDGHEKWALLAGADVLLVPSVQENFANVVAEAMAVGTVVIATEGVGASTYLKKADADLVISRDQEVLNNRLAALLADPVRRSRIGDVSRKIAATDLGWPSIAAQMVKIYRGNQLD